MNPYDVLGIRPNATSQELELAYRSRRTQYHPDKYAQSDAETVRWATAKMQEVNAAYAALSDVAQRQGLKNSAHAAEDPRPAPAPEEASPSLAALFRTRLAPYGGFSRIFFAPHIPQKKLEAAQGSYGRDIPPKDVLVLVDITVFGGAKEGALLTAQGIRSKELASSPSDLAWRDIREIDLRGTAIWLNGHKVCDCTMVDKPELVRLVGVLREFLASLHSGAGSTSTPRGPRGQAASETPWADPALCQQVYCMAKERLVALSEALAPWEEQADEQWLDRPALADLLESAQGALLEPGTAKLAYRYVLAVGLICEAGLGCLAGSAEPVDPALLRNNWDDPVVIRELRLVLAGLIEISARQREHARTERFFRYS